MTASVLLSPGTVLAGLSAVSYALQYLCVRVGTEEENFHQGVVIVLLCNMALITPVAVVRQFPRFEITPVAFAGFAGAGLSGLLLARYLTYMSTETVGASRTSAIVASSSLFSAVFGVFLLGETVTEVHAAGIVAIVFGLVLVSRETTETRRRASVRSRRQFLIPLLAALLIAIEPVFMKIGIASGASVFPGLSIMAGVAAAGGLGHARVSSALELGAIRRETAWYWFLAAGVCSTLSLVAYYMALEFAPVSVTLPIVQTAPLVVVGLSVLFMPQRLEQVTWRLVLATVIVVCGAIAVSATG